MLYGLTNCDWTITTFPCRCPMIREFCIPVCFTHVEYWNWNNFSGIPLFILSIAWKQDMYTICVKFGRYYMLLYCTDSYNMYIYIHMSIYRGLYSTLTQKHPTASSLRPLTSRKTDPSLNVKSWGTRVSGALRAVVGAFFGGRRSLLLVGFNTWN